MGASDIITKTAKKSVAEPTIRKDPFVLVGCLNPPFMAMIPKRSAQIIMMSFGIVKPFIIIFARVMTTPRAMVVITI